MCTKEPTAKNAPSTRRRVAGVDRQVGHAGALEPDSRPHGAAIESRCCIVVDCLQVAMPQGRGGAAFENKEDCDFSNLKGKCVLLRFACVDVKYVIADGPQANPRGERAYTTRVPTSALRATPFACGKINYGCPERK